MRRLTVEQVHSQKVRELGLDSEALDLASTEAIAGALRRAATFLCPCAPATLVRAVVRPLRGLVDDLEGIKVIVEDVLEAIVAHGDLSEFRNVEADSSAATLLYAAPPSFVARKSGAIILLGIAPDQLSALPDALEARLEHAGHLRRLIPAPNEDLRQEVVDLGLVEVTYDAWLKAPPPEGSAQALSRSNQRLAASPLARDVPGLVVLDPARPVRYYRGRWVEPRSQTGCFIARRDQAYGAKLWCYVELENGTPRRLIDLPLRGSRWRGCDEAWHLQMAIDAQRNDPQRYRLRVGPGGTRIMEFFSPAPMWARRRWDAVGDPVPGTGHLFAYRLPEREVAEEVRFLREAMWLGEVAAVAS